jgi:hypothetical protein
MIRVGSIVLVIVCHALLSPCSGAARNLIVNPGMEEGSASSTAASWESLVIGAPAQFRTDEQIKHGGHRSMCIDAVEITRAYIRSNPITVAPGEVLDAAAWVRQSDVPADRGTIIMIAEFSQGPHELRPLQKVAVADRPSEWQLIRGRVMVPPSATSMRLRLGLSYSRGTVWWDDVDVHTQSSLAARLELPENRLYPAMRNVPVTVLNWEGAEHDVLVRVCLDKDSFTATSTLNGENRQQVLIPVQVSSRGRRILKVELLHAGGADVFFSSGDMQVQVPPPLTFHPLIPTHWVIEDGSPQFAGLVEVALGATDARAVRLDIRVLDDSGVQRAIWTRQLNDDDAAGFTELEVQVPDLPPGAYRVVAEARRDSARVAASEQPWHVIRRHDAHVTLNADGFLAHNGKQVFPLGMFNNGARMEESARAGFNIAHFYNAARVQPGRRPDDQRLKDAMDRAQKCGMRCLLLVPMEFAIAGDWEAFRRRIRMFRNHPALLAWDEEEGIARGDMKPETLAQIRRVLQEEDPHHPLMVGDSYDVIGRVTDRTRFFPTQHMDLGMWWWYPFPLQATGDGALAGDESATDQELLPPAFLAQRDSSRPIWTGVQAYRKPRATARYPTPAEYRAQAYLAIIHGAKGLMWYGGSVTGGLFLDPAAGHWEDLKALARELRDLEPVLETHSQPPPTILPTDAPVSVTLKHVPGRRVLLSANRSLSTVEVTLIIPDPVSGEVIARGENRTIAVSEGRVHDRFAPLEVHVYEFPAD